MLPWSLSEGLPEDASEVRLVSEPRFQRNRRQRPIALADLRARVFDSALPHVVGDRRAVISPKGAQQTSRMNSRDRREGVERQR